MPFPNSVRAHLEALPSARGKRFVVTGANGGLGREIARQLAQRGATVILTSRDAQKGEDARADVLQDLPDAKLEVELLDLGSLASVRAAAERVIAGGGLDGLVANAGVMALPRRLTEDGFETQFGVNHLGHFAFTGLLLPALLQRPGARVVSVTSGAAFRASIDFEDPMGERSYDRWRAYAQSKLANLAFALGLARRLAAAGADASAHAAHPGLVFTELQRNVVRDPETRPSWPERFFLQRITPTFGQSEAMGALPLVFAALSPEARSGDLWGPRWIARGAPVLARVPTHAADAALQDRLWQLSEELTGVRFVL